MTGRDSAASVAQADWFRRPELRRVLALLNDGGEARIVGGAVRNALMGLPVGDIDIATTLPPKAVMARAKAAGVKAVPTGIAHGTVTLVAGGHPFEVTTLRADLSTDGRRAEVAFGTDWDADARRRDLTINGLYADATGRVIDAVGGIEDIATGTVRFIGDAATRIEEDYLRILRFFRFFAWYGKGRPDAEGLRASARLKTGLKKLSAERVWSEFKRLLAAPNPSRSLLWMRQAGILSEVLPESEKWGIDAIMPLVEAESALGWPADPLLRLMAIVPPDGKRVAAMARRLRLSNAEARRLKRWAAQSDLPESIDDAALRRMLYRADPQAVDDRLKLRLAGLRRDTQTGQAADAVGHQLAIVGGWEKPRFPLTGADLQAEGIGPGPSLGKALADLEEAWLESDFTLGRDALLARLRSGNPAGSP